MTLALGTVPSGTTLYIPFSTYAGSTGASVTMTGLAVTDIEIYKNGSTTQRASDAGYALLDTDGIDFDGVTGIHGFSIDLSDNTDSGFYAVGSWYWVVVSAVTVDSQTVNFISAVFRIGPAESVAGYPKADVSHFGGTAGTFASGRPEVNTTHVAGTSQTAGDIIGDTNDIQSRLPAALVSGRMDASVGAMAANVITAAATAADYLAEINAEVDTAISDAALATAANLATVAGYLDTEIPAILADTNELQTDWANGGRLDLILDARASQTSVDDLPTNAELATALGTADDAILAVLGTPAGASLAADIAAIEAQTDDIGAAGAGLTAVPWNAAWDAEVQSEVADALAAYGAATATDVTTAAANVSVDEIQATALADLFNTDSATTYASAVAGSVVKEIADNAGGASLTAADIADAVWEEAIADHSGTAGSTAEALAAAGSAGDPWITALPGAYTSGQAGYILGTNLNATVSSRASQSSVDTIDGIVDSILLDTAEIGAAGAGLTAVPWNASWDAEVQSEVADALAVYDPPTNAEMEARTIAAASYATAANLATVQSDTNDIQSRLPAALVDGKMDSTNSDTVVRGTADTGASTTSIPTSAFSPSGAVEDQFKGRIVIFDNDTATASLRGQATDITASSAAGTPTLTVTALTTAPASGDTFSIV